MPAQSVDGECRQLNLTARLSRFRLHGAQLTVDALERALDGDDAAVEVDIAPSQREQLTLAHAGAHRDSNQRLERPTTSAVEQLVHLLDRQHRHLELPRLW